MKGRYVDLYEAFKLSFLTPEGKQTCWEAQLLDWGKARETEVEIESTTELWEAVLIVGFRRDRVLSLVDPAIRDLVDRMLDLPILTLNSCSGHVVEGEIDGSRHPYLTVVFKEAEFGKKFIKALEKAFDFDPETVLAVDGHRGGCFGGMGPRISIEDSLKYKLIMSIYWGNHPGRYPNRATLTHIWTTFGEVLEQFDGKKTPPIEPALFGKSVSGKFPREWKKELQKLP
jgi:hypothetical protein